MPDNAGLFGSYHQWLRRATRGRVKPLAFSPSGKSVVPQMSSIVLPTKTPYSAWCYLCRATGFLLLLLKGGFHFYVKRAHGFVIPVWWIGNPSNFLIFLLSVLCLLISLKQVFCYSNTPYICAPHYASKDRKKDLTFFFIWKSLNRNNPHAHPPTTHNPLTAANVCPVCAVFLKWWQRKSIRLRLPKPKA